MKIKIQVWDLPTRVFHWLLALLVLGLIITGQTGGNAMIWHGRMGYAVLVLLIFRLAWGFLGSYHSRFSSFFPTLSRIRHHFSSAAEKTLGHNPLGAISIFGFLALLLFQVITGLFADDEIAYSGPLTALISNAWVSLATKWHSTIGKILLIVLVITHIAAVLYYLIKKKENLIAPMISGTKEVDAAAHDPEAEARLSVAQRCLAVILVFAASGFVTWLVSLGAQSQAS